MASKISSSGNNGADEGDRGDNNKPSTSGTVDVDEEDEYAYLREMDDHPLMQETIRRLQDRIYKVERLLMNLLNREKYVYTQLTAAERAQHDLFIAYTLNSLYWLYLRTKGRNSVSQRLKNELNRVKTAMDRANELKDKALAPRLDVEASKRFIRSGLWTPQQQQQQQSDQQQTKTTATATSTSDEPSTSRKRKHSDTDES